MSNAYNLFKTKEHFMCGDQSKNQLYFLDQVNNLQDESKLRSSPVSILKAETNSEKATTAQLLMFWQTRSPALK